MFVMINHNNDIVKSITRFKLFSSSPVLAENYSYVLYQYNNNVENGQQPLKKHNRDEQQILYSTIMV